MSVTSREVKNKRDRDGNKTGRPGKVYDVSFKYKADDDTFKPYGKRGFSTKSEALKHENEMKIALENNVNLRRSLQTDKNITVEEYLLSWVDKHFHNKQIKPSTYAGYKTAIKQQIIPFIGKVKAEAINIGND